MEAKNITKAALISTLVGIAALCWGVFVWFFPASPLDSEPEYFHVVVDSTQSIEEAKKKAIFFKIKGYDSAVYLSANGYYAVTIGLLRAETAIDVKKEAIKRGVIDEGSYILPRDNLVARIELKGFEDNVYIQVGSFIKQDSAVSQASKLRKHGFDSQVYLGEAGMYAVVLGEFHEEKPCQRTIFVNIRINCSLAPIV